MAGVTPEEMRALLAEYENHVEDRVARLMNSAVQPVKEQMQRIEVQTVKTNGRTTALEAWRIDNEARAAERGVAAKEAAALASEQAAAVLAARERSRKWWLGLATVIAAVIGAVSTLGAFAASYLHHL